MSSSDSDVDLETAALRKILPPKSKVKYIRAYEMFMNWKMQNQKDSLDESVFLDYFTKLSNEIKPSSLWSVFSMLKCTVHFKHNISIQNYANLTRFLKKKSQGFKSVASMILTEENIKTFLNEAPDDIYLATKVALILGVCGACRSGELCKLTTKNIKKHGEVLVVTVRDSQYNTDRVFVIQDELTELIQRYQALRPKRLETDRFFLKYHNGKCIRQVIGMHKISSMPKAIATFLKLPNPKSYTGHCFRRSSAGFSGVNVITGNRKNRGKFGDDLEGLIDSAVDTKTQQKLEEINKTVKRNNETARDRGNITAELTQDIQVEIEDNPNCSTQSLRNVQTFRSFTSRALSELEMEFDKESDDLSEDPIQIKTEDVDETMNLRPQGNLQATSQPSGSNERVRVSTDEKHTSINIAGKNIKIIFKNCANVGNITINVLKD